MTTRKEKDQGMNWIRKEKRLAIYLRDGLACCYCGQGIEDGATLTLDHVIPYSEGGSNKEGNLVTACRTCNSSRGTRTVKDFCAATASYLNHGILSEDIISHIDEAVTHPIDVAAAKELIARRGGFALALHR